MDAVAIQPKPARVDRKTKTFYMHLALKESHPMGGEAARARATTLKNAINRVLMTDPCKYLILKGGPMLDVTRNRLEVCVSQNEQGQPCALIIYYTLARYDRTFNPGQLKQDLIAELGVTTLYWDYSSNTKTDTSMFEFAAAKKVLL